MLTPDEKPGEKALKEQVDFLLDQLRVKAIDIHKFMKLLSMAYEDYYEFYPEEFEEKYGQRSMERKIKDCQRNLDRDT